MSIDVSGGSGGMAVVLDELEAAARRLAELAERTATLALRAAGLELDPGLLASVPLSPLTAAQVDWALAHACGVGGLAGDAALLEELALAVRGAVTAYRLGEAAVDGSMAAASDLTMFTVAPVLPVAVGELALLAAEGVPVVPALDRLVFEAPAVVDVFAGGGAGMLTGLAAKAPAMAGLLMVAAARAGRPFPPLTYEDAVATLAGAGELGGLFHDGTQVSVTLEPKPQSERPPRDLHDLMLSQSALEDGEAYPGHVRVAQVPQGDGTSAWLVQVSGTQDWSPRAGSNPFDLTSNLLLMARQQSLLTRGVQQALEHAMAADGSHDHRREPVMLSGHSEGGIAAAALASSAAFRQRHQVTDVVAAGAPIARFPVPGTVSVLSLEHRQDPVPRLDGRANPDQRRWVTVTRDVASDATVRASGLRAHAAMEYAQTAAEADSSAAASLRTWRDGSARFFAGDTFGRPVVRDYRLERVDEPRVARSTG